MSGQYENPGRLLVTVSAIFNGSGGIEGIVPKYIKGKNGRWYELENVQKPIRAASPTAGGFGIQYAFVHRGRTRHLVLDENRFYLLKED